MREMGDTTVGKQAEAAGAAGFLSSATPAVALPRADSKAPRAAMGTGGRLDEDGFLEHLAGLEGRSAPGRDGPLLARLGVAPPAGGPLSHFKSSEPNHLHPITPGEGGRDLIEYRVDHRG